MSQAEDSAGNDSGSDPTAHDVVTMEKIVALCKRRGFVFPSSEIYGGVGSTYDFGHYGVLLKGNVKGEWWRAMLQDRDDIVAIDSAILSFRSPTSSSYVWSRRREAIRSATTASRLAGSIFD